MQQVLNEVGQIHSGSPAPQNSLVEAMDLDKFSGSACE